MTPHALKAGVSAVKTVMEFCISTLIGVLEVTAQVKEDMVARLLPFLLEGLRSSNVDWSVGTMMVISQLCSRVHLDEKLTVSFIDIVSKNLTEQTVDESLSCIAYICQSQSLHYFPKKAAKHFCKRDYVMSSLQKLDSTCDIDKLQQLLMDQLVAITFSCFVVQQEDSQDIVSSQSSHPYCNVLMKLLRNLRIDKGIVVHLIKDLLHRYVTIRGSLDSDSLPQLHVFIRPLLKAVEARFSSEFDNALELYLKELTGRSCQTNSANEMVTDESGDKAIINGVENKSEWIQELISFVLSGSRHAVIRELSTSTLTISLHHPSAEVRRSTVLQLDKTIHDVKEDVSLDVEFYRDALLARLQDDAPAVVQAVIEMGQHLIDITGCNELVQPFIHTMDRQLQSNRRRDKLWQQVCLSMTKLITSAWSLYSQQAQDNILVALLPHLLLLPKTHKFSTNMATVLTSSTFISDVPLLSGLPQIVSSQAWLQLPDSKPSPDKLANINSLLLKCLASGWLKMTKTKKMKLAGLLATCVQQSTPYSPLVIITLGLLDCVLLSVQKEQSLLLCGLSLELIQPSLITLSNYSHRDIPKSKKDEISLMPQRIPQFLEEALLPLMMKRQTHRAVQLSHLQLRLASSICKHLDIPSSAKENVWLKLPSTTAPNDQYTQILLQLFDVFLEGSRSQSEVAYFPLFQELLCNFIKCQLGDEGSLIRFIAVLWTSPVSGFQLHLNIFADLVCGKATDQQQAIQTRNPVNFMTITRGLLVTVKYLQTRLSAFKVAMMLDECPVIPSFLVALCSPVQMIRKAVLKCLQIIYTTGLESRSSSALFDLAGVVCEGAGEIETDSDYIYQLLSNALSTSHSKKVKQQNQSLESQISIIRCVMGYVTEDETPIYVKQGILEVFRDVDSKYKLKFCLPFLGTLLEKSTNFSDMLIEEKQCLKLLIQQYTPATARLIGSEDKLVWSLFEKCLHATGKAMSIQTLALAQITKNFYKALSGSSFQQHLLLLLCDLATSSESASTVKQVLANIHLKATDVITVLETVTLKHSSATTPAKRIKSSSTLPESQMRQLQRALTILEIVHQEQNVRDAHLFIPKLFGMLNQCVLLMDLEEFDFDYIIQLLLSCITKCCEQIAPDGRLKETHLLHDDQFSVELVVQCVRTSKSPQTHQHALLLLNIAAQLFPESVMHKIMPIFTFMGTSLLRMDDTYSMQIVKKTVETVVPAVIKATESSSGDSTDLIRTLLHVFVDASPHIPRHRQLPILQHLLKTLGVAAHLHELLALLVEQSVLHSVNKQEIQLGVTPISEKFCLSLVMSFSALDQTIGLTRLLEYLQELPEVKPQVSKTQRQKKKSSAMLALFSVEANTEKQLQHFKLACVSLVASTLASEQYATKVLELTEDDEHQLESNYLHLLGVTLTLISQTAVLCEKYAQEGSSKFWRVFLSKEYSVIKKLTRLLSSTALVEVVCQLIQHSNATVRRKAMELFNSHTTDTKGKYTPDQVPALLNLTNVLTTVVAPLDVAESDQLLETPLNRQTALYSLKLLARMLGSQQQQHFLPVATACFQIVSDKAEMYEVVSSALLCVAQQCAVLGPHLIPYLPSFVPSVLNHLLDSRNVDQPKRDLLQLSAATCLLKVVEHLSKFLSPYMVDILQRTCHSSFSQMLCSNFQLSEKLHIVRSLLAKSVPVRVLCPAITDYYTSQLDQVIVL
jgi:U3 small nucleolar RNA-associated protein 10